MPAPLNQPAVIVDADPARNEAADRVVDILTGEAPFDDSDEADWGVPKELIAKAGRALANRYCFAVERNGDGELSVLITPIRHFEKEGACSDQSGPVDHLLPPKMGNLSESTWEFYAEWIRQPIDAARELQRHGFYWNRDFQDFIDPALTQELSVLEPVTAVEKVMDFIERQDDLPWDFTVPADIYAEAVKEGLATKFSYFLRHIPAAENPYGEDADVSFAVIFPTGKDGTWKGPNFLRPLVPEGEAIDECMETEWHFADAALSTPAGIARLLSGKGMTFAQADQREYAELPAQVMRDVLEAIKPQDKAPAPPAPKQPRCPPFRP
jgi:hypothetical protein